MTDISPVTDPAYVGYAKLDDFECRVLWFRVRTDANRNDASD